MTETNYRWKTPHQWLIEKANQFESVPLSQSKMMDLIRMLDGDEIQFKFQREMDADGFFDLIINGETGKQFLEKTFEMEFCSACGRDAEDHTAVPFNNNWFARCDKEPLTDEEYAARNEAFITDEA